MEVCDMVLFKIIYIFSSNRVAFVLLGISNIMLEFADNSISQKNYLMTFKMHKIKKEPDLQNNYTVPYLMSIFL